MSRIVVMPCDGKSLAKEVRSLSSHETSRMEQRIHSFRTASVEFEGLVLSDLPKHMRAPLLSLAGLACAELMICFLECAQVLTAEQKIVAAVHPADQQIIKEELRSALADLAARRKSLK